MSTKNFLSVVSALKWPTGSGIVFFRQLERLNILKVDGQLCNFLHCATKPNDKFNAPLVLEGSVVAQQQPQPHVEETNKNTLRRRWSALPARL